MPPLVEIGLTDLPKSGGARAPPAPPLATGLYIDGQNTADFFSKNYHWGRDNGPPLVEIVLTDLTKSGGARAPLAPPLATGLHF